MKGITSHLIIALLAASVAHRAVAGVLTFEQLPRTDLERFYYGGLDDLTAARYGQANRNHYGGVIWDGGWSVASDAFAARPDPSDGWCTESTQPFAQPHSGHTVLFNAFGYDGLGFSTTQILTGVWFARPTLADAPGGAVQVTVTAFAGASAVAAESLDLVDTTPVFMDTSVFLFHRGITRYTIHRAPDPTMDNSCPDAGYFIADDFQFASRSLVDVCPCSGPWRSHAEYVRCFHRAIVALVKQDALTRRQARQLLRDALAALSAATAWAQPGALDPTFPVQYRGGLALALQRDGKILTAGNYVNPINGASVARLNEDGSLDESFVPAIRPFTEDFGLGGTLWSVAVQHDNKILIGGRVRLALDEYTEQSAGLARLNPDGSIDPGFHVSSAVGDVLAIALQRDGKILIGGGVIDVPPDLQLPVSSHIVRLHRDGSIDRTFNAGVGEDHSVNAIGLQHDRKVIIGGAFRTVNGVARSGLARLNADGSLDPDFHPLIEGQLGPYRGGFTSLPGVFAVVVQHDRRILIGGVFTHVNRIARSGIARLNADGSVDLEFDPGLGADAPVSALDLDKHERILVGGDFLAVNGIPRSAVARLNANGSVDLTFVPAISGAWVRALTVAPHEKLLLGGTFNPLLPGSIDPVSLVRLELGRNRGRIGRFEK